MAIKASIQQNSFTTERVLELLHTGLSNGNSNNINGYALASQSVTQTSTSLNIEIEATLTTSAQEKPGLQHAGGHPVQHRPHGHGIHGHHHQPAPQLSHHHGGPAPAANTVRIEAGSAAELIEKAQNVSWDN